MEQGFNVTPLLIALGQTVPVWAIVAFAVTSYLKKSKETITALDKRLIAIEEDIHQIQLSLASVGIDSLEKDVEALKESKAQVKVQIESLWRAIEDHRIPNTTKSRHDND